MLIRIKQKLRQLIKHVENQISNTVIAVPNFEKYIL